MFLFGLSQQEGWFFSPTFHVYQRVNERVYCYVSRMMGFYTLQLYERSTTGLCTLEARSENNMEALFALGEKWLQDHYDFNQKKITENPFYIGQHNWHDKCWI
ncbi:hypothetical protein PP175_29550 (plasmid) [Aneurinibacillus sp. Ricciae_BoGa-3]|uniref:hypothetical protein n=1 Tax=Aneurinibacillus sp. Ricciae_BoGa-3 TaxID=3022697 RepID=UPI00234025C9|nr:hypothetical protein [Aneurinibacillus sp. Ricciae_BoGa-3]WCK57338.1 hypothetical protein PP175_29550 [Aneurinibacillus sp. Ricciae_BoGa-3]